MSPFIVVFAFLVAGIFFLNYVPIGLWMEAMSGQVSISLWFLITMKLRRVEPAAVIKPLIMGRQAGLTSLGEKELEAHYLAGGNVTRVVRALIEAHKAGIDLDFTKAAAIDLAGRDVLEAVSM